MNPDSVLTKLLHWRNAFFAKHNRLPKTIPVSAEEINQLVTDTNCATYMDFMAHEPPQVAGMLIEKTDIADSLRSSRIKMPVIRLSESAEFSPQLEVIEGRDEINNRLFRRLNALVIGETSKLEFRIECDPWAKIKRWLRLNPWLRKWFPIRRVQVCVDCTVLYPFIKVTLPHHRHTVKFSAAGNSASNAGGAASKSCCGATPRQPRV